uniref:DUF5824 domain-containing protein n=1 Tax=viral metagenome TaxID=1070528 RepID=A0A6C0D7L4_9ZZZZ
MDILGQSISNMPATGSIGIRGSQSDSNMSMPTTGSIGIRGSQSDSNMSMPMGKSRRSRGSRSDSNRSMSMTRSRSRRSRGSRSDSNMSMPMGKSRPIRGSRSDPNMNAYKAGIEEGVNLSKEIYAAIPRTNSSYGLFGGTRRIYSHYKTTARNRKYLKKYKQGKSIGFTMRSSLKAKGLIPRSNGTYKVSKKYRG